MLHRPLLIALSLALCLPPARGIELTASEAPTPSTRTTKGFTPMEVDLKADGDYRAKKLPDGVRQIGLVKDIGGFCRAGRTWGFDEPANELWVSGRCNGRFRLDGEAQAASQLPAASPEAGASAEDAEKKKADRNKKIAIGAAAAAVLVGAVLLGRNKDDKRREEPTQYPPNNYPPSSYPPNSYPPNDGGYDQARPLQTVEGQLCLDLRGGLQQGSETQLARCTQGNSQRFWLTPQGELRVAGMCLDVAGSQREDGARVVAWPCTGQRNQQWRRSGQELRSLLADKCLDVRGGKMREGETVLLWSCSGRANQRWW